MPDILVRGLEAETVKRLKARADRHGRSLQSEVKMLVERAAGTGGDQIAAVLKRWEGRFAGRRFSSSAQADSRGPQAMKRLVVDASVVAAAFFPERHSEAARRLLLSGGDLSAPDLIYAEIANVVWKRHGRGEITAEEAAGLLSDVLELPLEITPSEQLVAAALALAVRTGRTVYDCLYVALAVQTRTVMVSDDQRLVCALAGGPLNEHVAWLGAEQ